MKTMIVGVLAVGLVVTFALSPGAQVIAQQSPCLHGANESADQQVRRRQALTMARQINSAEAVAFSRATAYQPIAVLNGVSNPAGFVAHSAVDASG